MRYGFLAEANVHIGITVAADVAAFEEDDANRRTPERCGGNGRLGAPQPPLVVPVDFTTLETFEIRIYDQERARTLVAAVELVSPATRIARRVAAPSSTSAPPTCAKACRSSSSMS